MEMEERSFTQVNSSITCQMTMRLRFPLFRPTRSAVLSTVLYLLYPARFVPVEGCAAKCKCLQALLEGKGEVRNVRGETGVSILIRLGSRERRTVLWYWWRCEVSIRQNRALKSTTLAEIRRPLSSDRRKRELQSNEQHARSGPPSSHQA